MPVGPGWAAWVALAVALAVTAVPSPDVGRVDELVERGRLTRRPARRRGVRVDVPWPVVGAAGAAGGVAAVAAIRGPALAVAAGAALATAGLLVRDLVARRRAERRRRSLGTGLRVLVGELEAGGRPADALRAAAAVGGDPAPVFAGAAARVERGDDPAPEFAAGRADFAALAAAWQVSEAAGAAPAAVLDRVALDLAAADGRRREVAVALAGPRSSAVVLSGLPLVGIALGAAMGADPVSFLLGEPVGRLLACGGVLLDVAGVLWIRALVRRAER